MQIPRLGHAVAQGTDGDARVPPRHCFPCHQLQAWLSICRYSSIQIVLHTAALEPTAPGLSYSPWGQSWGQGRASCPFPLTPGRAKHHKISSGSSTHQLPPAGVCIKVTQTDSTYLHPLQKPLDFFLTHPQTTAKIHSALYFIQ